MQGRRSAVIGTVLATIISVALAAQTPQKGAEDAKAAAAPAFTTHLIDVGGRRVTFHVAPGRLPAVVFIAGGGEDGSSWNPVTAPIQRRTGAELITIDRAGFGESDEDTRPVRIENEVADVEAGLSALHVAQSFILVAHSYGGEVATSLVNRDPSRVAYAVLVDTSIPSFFTDEEITKFEAVLPKDMPTENKEERTQAALFKVYPTLLHQFHQMDWPRSIPTTVIVSEHPPLATQAENTSWTEEHRKFAQAAPNRSFVLAQRSGHIVMTDRPDVVTDAVVLAVDQVRRSHRL